MELPAALAHMRRQIELALGELELPTPKLGALALLRLPVLRELVIFGVPFPKGAKTAPGLLQADADDIDEERRQLEAVIERAAQRGTDGPWTPHPLFGALGGRAWGTLMARHLDHHLRQFGV